MFEWNGFNYWAAEHYDHKVVQGTEEHCLALFRAEQMNRPTNQYGTRIVDKEHDEETDEWQMVFRWFKTKEVYKKHLGILFAKMEQSKKANQALLLKSVNQAAWLVSSTPPRLRPQVG